MNKASVLFLLCCIANIAQAQPAYIAEELSIPADITRIELTDINDSEEIVGWGSSPTTHLGIYWADTSVPLILDDNGYFLSTQAWGINNNGQVTGEFYRTMDDDQVQGFFRWVPEQAPELVGSFEGQSFSRGVDINDDGTITGFIVYRDTNSFIFPGESAPRVGVHSFLLDQSNNFVLINSPDTQADVRAVNNNTTVIGRIDGAAYRFDLGLFTFLTVDPRDINDNGMVVGTRGGYCGSYNHETQLAIEGLWNNSQYACIPLAINNSDTVVGTYQLSQGVDNAFVFTDQFYNLNDVAQLPHDVVLTGAMGINSGGVIVAEGHLVGDPSAERYYKLTPTEPEEAFDLAWLIPVINLILL